MFKKYLYLLGLSLAIFISSFGLIDRALAVTWGELGSSYLNKSEGDRFLFYSSSGNFSSDLLSPFISNLDHYADGEKVMFDWQLSPYINNVSGGGYDASTPLQKCVVRFYRVEDGDIYSAENLVLTVDTDNIFNKGTDISSKRTELSVEGLLSYNPSRSNRYRVDLTCLYKHAEDLSAPFILKGETYFRVFPTDKKVSFNLDSKSDCVPYTFKNSTKIVLDRDNYGDETYYLYFPIKNYLLKTFPDQENFFNITVNGETRDFSYSYDGNRYIGDHAGINGVMSLKVKGGDEIEISTLDENCRIEPFSFDFSLTPRSLFKKHPVNSFNVSSPASSGSLGTVNINDDGGKIDIKVLFGTDISSLVPQIGLALPEFTISPASGQTQDFTNPVEYTVNFGDGTTKTYTVTVRPETPPDPLAPIPITSCTDLQNIKNDLTKNYYLANDIDCSVTKNWNGGYGFGMITGDFTGTLDGRGYKISGLYVNRPKVVGGPSGLFSSNKGTIKNLRLENESIRAVGGSATGLVITNSGTIDNVYVQGSIGVGDYGYGSAGGIVVTNLGEGLIMNSYVNVGLYAPGNYMGGLAAENYGTIANSYARASTEEQFGGTAAGQKYRGAITGKANASGKILNSYAVTGELVGSYEGSVILSSGAGSNCSRSGAIATSTCLGSIPFADFKDTATYHDWDFLKIWNQDAGLNEGLPFLRFASGSLATTTYNLITGNSAGGILEKNPDRAYYFSGETVTLTAIPRVGYVFTGWVGSLSGTTNPQTITMDSHKVVIPTFAPAPISGQCGDAAKTYASTATAFTGSLCFVGTANPAAPSFPVAGSSTAWSCLGQYNGANASCAANRGAVTTQTVQPVYYSVLTSNSAMGSISLSPAGTLISGRQAYKKGTVVTATAVPRPGYKFAYWAGNLSGKANPSTFTMDSNKVIAANFTPVKTSSLETENRDYAAVAGGWDKVGGFFKQLFK